MKKHTLTCAILFLTACVIPAVTGCSRNDDPEVLPGEILPAPDGDDGTLFILNEGNFQYSNATLSIYNPEKREVTDEAFIKANGMKLGDVAQSMTIYGDRGWIVVNNSNVIFAIDPTTLKEKGRIENLTFPRYIHFVSDTKAYVTQLWDNRIAIINPQTYQITGHIDVPDMKPGSGSTEQMVSYGDFVYCNCWSYQKRIIKIDTRSDEVVASLEVGIQPNSLALDCNGKLWTVTDGGFEGSPFGYEAPALVKIDAETFKIENKFSFSLGDSCSEICLNGEKDRLYWINDDIWEMDVTASAPPSAPLLKAGDTLYYGLTVAPVSGDIYVADAIDYQQNGIIYRYSRDGKLIDHFNAGINPGAFCWYIP
ncbi:MAG: glutaminyl-peptide cyclotransferase [Muribaculaceae bacterium]|nr:glutaminyl-peptide cyclotransferase [Muribaculaceae bacterium]